MLCLSFLGTYASFFSSENLWQNFRCFKDDKSHSYHAISSFQRLGNTCLCIVQTFFTYLQPFVSNENLLCLLVIPVVTLHVFHRKMTLQTEILIVQANILSSCFSQSFENRSKRTRAFCLFPPQKSQ